jgi:hypothetical protein
VSIAGLLRAQEAVIVSPVLVRGIRAYNLAPVVDGFRVSSTRAGHSEPGEHAGRRANEGVAVSIPSHRSPCIVETHCIFHRILRARVGRIHDRERSARIANKAMRELVAVFEEPDDSAARVDRSRSAVGGSGGAMVMKCPVASRTKA